MCTVDINPPTHTLPSRPAWGWPGCTSFLLLGGPDVQGCGCGNSQALAGRWEVAGPCMAMAGPHSARLLWALRLGGCSSVRRIPARLPIPDPAREENTSAAWCRCHFKLPPPLPLRFFPNQCSPACCAQLEDQREIRAPTPHPREPCQPRPPARGATRPASACVSGAGAQTALVLSTAICFHVLASPTSAWPCPHFPWRRSWSPGKWAASQWAGVWGGAG